ncbi:unnamed protein product [Echinostoma caproni]|uniref:SprT-like domain-containing protein n=1 Tax=Echinostoma caproni TaxID=27848 RepID=A0A183BFT9_9TREM|nr:unnamed protein product [Echinostoma caproni]
MTSVGPPFHLDCLLHSRARSRRTSGLRSQSRRPVFNPKVLQSRHLDEWDVRNAVGYIGLQSPLAHRGAMMAETRHGSLYLCRTCLRVAGQTLPTLSVVAESLSDSDESHVFTGDEEWGPLSDESDDKLLVPSDDSADPKRNNSPEPDIQVSAGHSRILQPVDDSSGVSDDCSFDTPSTRRAKRLRRRPSLRRKSTVPRGPARNSLRDDQQPNASRICGRRASQANCTESIPDMSVDNANQSVTSSAKKRSRLDSSSDSDSLKDIMIKFPTLKRVSVVLDPCDLSTIVTHCDPPVGGAVTRRCRPARRYSTPSFTRHSSPESDCETQSPKPSETNLDQSAVQQLLTDLCKSSCARPLLRCGAGRPHHGILTEPNVSDSSDESQQHTAHRIPPRKSLPPRNRRRPARLGAEPIREKLRAWDLNSLQDLVSRGQLPGGPQTAVSHLRLLIQHWLLTNRPGSRIHDSALAVSALLDRKLMALNHPVEEERS